MLFRPICIKEQKAEHRGQQHSPLRAAKRSRQFRIFYADDPRWISIALPVVMAVGLFAGLGEPIIGHFMDGHPTSIVFLIVSVCATASATVALFIRR